MSETKCHAENRCKNYRFVTVRSYERIRIFKCLEKKYGNFVIFRYFSLRTINEQVRDFA